MGSKVTRRPCALAACALFFVSAPAFAAPTAAERETARKLMDEGNGRMRAGDPAKAVESFQKANDVMHVPTTGIALAKAQLAAGHLVEAREEAIDVARTQREPGEPAVFEKARKQARDLEAQVKPRIPLLKIHVKGGNATHVTVDDIDVPIQLASEPVPVNPGKHTIAAKSADGDGKTDIEVKESEKKDVDIVVGAKTADPKPDVVAPKDTGPAAPKKVVGFGNDDVDTRAARRSSLAEGLIYGGFGVAIIGVGVGTVTGIMTLGKASSVSPQCANNICAPGAKKDLDSANSLSTVSTIAFGAGVVGIAAGVLGLVMPREGGSKRGALALHPTANGLGGTF